MVGITAGAETRRTATARTSPRRDKPRGSAGEFGERGFAVLKYLILGIVYVDLNFKLAGLNDWVLLTDPPLGQFVETKMLEFGLKGGKTEEIE